jgi:hypothetical protein
VVSKRTRSNRKTNSKSKSAAPALPSRWTLFGQPQLLPGEDAAAYDQLLARIRAAVNPIDVIEEMFITDLADLEWEVLRWRRLKSSLILARGLKAVEEFLSNELDYNLYSEDFADDLAEILEDNLSEGQAKDAQRLARACARNERDAVDKVNEVLAGIKLNTYGILKDARTREAKELVRDYVQRAPGAVKLLNELLTDAGLSIDAFMADALAEKLDYIERIDRLAAIAESRRNASLSEIERRRAAFGAKLRQNVQEIEDADFKVIELRQRQQRE